MNGKILAEGGGLMAGFIEIYTWKRKEHFDLFSKMDYPFFNICADLDITTFYKYIKENSEPFFNSFLYVASKAANQIEEFRYRIREDGIYLHDIVNPSFTVMSNDDLFSFCYSDYSDNYLVFKDRVRLSMDKVKEQGNLNEEPRDDYLYITSLPWISFTSVSHPYSISKTDSIPRISWGKFKDNSDGSKTIPLSVCLHHGLADGFHAAKYFSLMQKYLDSPEINL